MIKTVNIFQKLAIILMPIIFIFTGFAQTEQEVVEKYLNGDMEITSQYQKDIITRYLEENVVNVHTFPKGADNFRVPFFTEDFTGTAGDSVSTTPPAGWQNEINAGGNPVQPWEFYTGTYNPGNTAYTIPSGGGFSGDYAVLNSDKYGSGNTQNTSIITPAINCTGRDNVYLSFSEQFRSIGSSSGTVSVSINGGTTWEDLVVRNPVPVGYPNPAVESIVFVPQATNQADVRFRFTYVGTWGYWWAIDNVSLEEGAPLSPLVGGNTYPINGTENPPVSFENITSVVAYMNLHGVTGTGQVILELSTGYSGTEPAPVIIGPVPGSTSTLGVTFRPAAGYTAMTEVEGAASPNQHAIALAGPSNLTLDGRSGGIGSSRDWTVKVTGTNGQMAVRLQNNAASMEEINIRNLIMVGEAANVTGAVFQLTGTTTNSMVNVVVEDNLITSSATSSSDTRGYGITVATNNAASTGMVIRNNDITNFYARGINITSPNPNMKVHDNRFYHTVPITQPTTTEFSAIYFSSTSVNGAGTEIFNNMVYDIQLTNHTTTATNGINGIYFLTAPASGDPVRVYNNVIVLGPGLTGTAADMQVYGIRENTSSTGNPVLDIFYNSVYIGGELTTGANNSAAFRKQLSSNLNLSNNIFYNARTNNGGTGTHWGIMTNNTSYSSISNNDYFADGIGSVLGTTTGTSAGNQTTLGDWLIAMGGADVGSVSQNPNYIAPTATPPNLKIDETIPTELESGGTPIAGITTDFEGDVRNVTTPDIGADEFNGILGDGSPPTISYTSLDNTNSTANRNITATITDPSGVQAGTNGPRLYFKKNFVGTYLFDDTPVVVGDDYTFTIDQTALGIVEGDSVYYYFAAQDSLGNAGTSPPGGSGSNPPGTTPPDVADAYYIIPGPMSGDFTIGVTPFRELSGMNITFERRVRTIQVEETSVDPIKGEQIGLYEETLKGTVTIQEPASEADLLPVTVTRTIEQEYYIPMLNGEEYDGALYYEFTAEDKAANNDLRGAGIYPTITAAIADANLRGVGGPVNFILLDATYPSETLPIVIGEITGVSSTNTITLRPDVGVTSTIEGSLNLPIFDLSGASYFIFDGRQGGVGTDNSLNIVNTSTTASSACIRFINGATNNVVQYVNLMAMASGSATRAIEFGTSVSNPSGNSDNLITNCDINSGRYCVYFSGTAANPNMNNVISNSKLYNGTFSGFYMLSNAENTTIAYNDIYNDSSQATANSAISLSASALGGVNNIVGNKIYDIQNTLTTTVRGITGTPGTLSTLNIVNNFFSLTQDNGTKTSIYAVQISGTTEYTVNAYYNTFRLGGVHTGGTAGTIVSGGLIKSNTGAASTFNAVNNIGVNNRSGGTSGVVHTNFFIGSAGLVGTLDIDYNVWWADGGAGAFHSGWNGFVYNNQQTYRDSAAPHEQNTIFKEVHFVSNTDLHVTGTSVGDLDLIGMPIAGITTDIDGDTRHLEFPYRGADEGDIPLPVELLSFAASVDGNAVSLTWSTASEINNNGFEIERKLNAGWENIGFLKGNGTTSSTSYYSFIDKYDFNAFTGTAFYRLKQIDFDGTFAYSNTVEVDVDFTPKDYALYQNYPNPFNPSTTIKYALPFDSNVKLRVYNLLGEVVSELVNSIQETGFYDINWNAGSLSSGIYFYTISAKSIDGQQDFYTVKKMLMIK